MIINISDKLGKQILECIDSKYYATYRSAYDAFLNEEIGYCADCYLDDLGEYTLDKINKEVELDLVNEEIDFVTTCYHRKVQREFAVFDMRTIKCTILEDNKPILVKEQDDDELLCTYEKDVYRLEIIKNEYVEDYVKFKDIEIPLSKFVEV